MTYICNICGTDSDKSEFYSGVTSRCKECHKKRVRENRADNIEYYRAYDAKRFKENPTRAEKNKMYAATEAGKASNLAAKKKWQRKNPEKRAAHVLLGNAIKSGRVLKPTKCELCGSLGRIHGHHEDYAKPLQVIWCCTTCHSDIHRNKEG